MKREGGMRTWLFPGRKEGGGASLRFFVLLLFLVWVSILVRLAKGYGMGCDVAGSSVMMM